MMRPSLHRFVTSEHRPGECAICGRTEAAHTRPAPTAALALFTAALFTVFTAGCCAITPPDPPPPSSTTTTTVACGEIVCDMIGCPPPCPRTTP